MKLILAFLLLISSSLQAQQITVMIPGSVAPSTTVSSLPTCNSNTIGRIYLVTDALAPVALSTVVGGGAVVAPVICTGAAWIVS